MIAKIAALYSKHMAMIKTLYQRYIPLLAESIMRSWTSLALLGICFHFPATFGQEMNPNHITFLVQYNGGSWQIGGCEATPVSSGIFTSMSTPTSSTSAAAVTQYSGCDRAYNDCINNEYRPAGQCDLNRQSCQRENSS